MIDWDKLIPMMFMLAFGLSFGGVAGYFIGVEHGENSSSLFWKRLLVGRGLAKWTPSPDGSRCHFDWIESEDVETEQSTG